MSTMQIGVVAAPHGAIVTVRQEPGTPSVVTGIEELPLSVSAIAERVADLALGLPSAQLVVDGQGIGSALWEVVCPDPVLVRGALASRDRLADGAPRLWLYAERGSDRQRLVNELVVADAQDLIRLEHGLAGLESMQRALVTYNPSVGDDGRVGGELVTALCLALLPRFSPPARLGAFLA